MGQVCRVVVWTSRSCRKQGDGLARGFWMRPEKGSWSGRCRGQRCRFVWEGRRPCHHWGGVGSHVTSLLPASSGAGISHCLSACAVLGAAAQNIKISLRFISSPSHSFEIPQFEGESYFNPLVPISLITVSIDNGQDSKWDRRTREHIMLALIMICLCFIISRCCFSFWLPEFLMPSSVSWRLLPLAARPGHSCRLAYENIQPAACS